MFENTVTEKFENDVTGKFENNVYELKKSFTKEQCKYAHLGSVIIMRNSLTADKETISINGEKESVIVTESVIVKDGHRTVTLKIADIETLMFNRDIPTVS